jgi:tripartite-type tricarboxylate transporter receptor subunit TctC
MVVAVPRSMPAAEKKQLTERLVAVINSDSFKATVAGFNNHPMGMTAPELFYYIETNRRIITRYWKQ